MKLTPFASKQTRKSDDNFHTPNNLLELSIQKNAHFKNPDRANCEWQRVIWHEEKLTSRAGKRRTRSVKKRVDWRWADDEWREKKRWYSARASLFFKFRGNRYICLILFSFWGGNTHVGKIFIVCIVCRSSWWYKQRKNDSIQIFEKKIENF